MNTSTRQRFQPIFFSLAIFYLTVSLLLRVVLWALFGSHEQVSLNVLPGILFVGMKNDIVVFFFLCLPISIYITGMPDRWFRADWHRLLWSGFIFAIIFCSLYLMVIEFFFFQEFDSRFNLVAVDYLLYPTEVFVNIWESYPVIWVLVFIALFATILFRYGKKWWTPHWEVETRLSHRLAFFSCHLVVLFLFFRISEAKSQFSENRVAAQLADNGLYCLLTAFRTHDIDYKEFYKTIPPERAHQLVHDLENPDTGKGNDSSTGNRRIPAITDGLHKMNIVVIVEESFGADFIGVLGNKKKLTPSFDRLSREGLLFSRAYATGTRTVRGLEAITLSFPPIPSESVIRRPGCEGMANWGELMRKNGYHASFLYGGYGYFDNMNHFYGSNGFDISDRSDITNPRFENIWGVSDEDLFDHASVYFDQVNQSGKPFFSIIMTTSNHRPFTFPKGIPGIPEKGGGRKAGVRYADYALGRFFDNIRNHPWMEKTLFVVVADHCARLYGRSEIPIKNYEIPLLMYAPGKLSAGIESNPVSQVDIAPTVLGLLGYDFQSPFFGQDVLRSGIAGADHPIFLSHNHDVAILEGNEMAVLGLNQSESVFRVDVVSGIQSPVEDTRHLSETAAAVYQTAFDLFESHEYVFKEQN
jgi:phosphoglycerol transferase MdoB-like AlkP superfamily enzyme